MLNNGDKLVVTKKISNFLNEGDVVKVVNVDNDVITFAFGEGFIHMGVMSQTECEEHFEKVVERNITTTEERIDEIIANSEINAQTMFDKCTIVSCKLPNGFVIVEYSACVDPKDYDEETGINICLEKIANKIWELEGYLKQEEFASNNYNCECDECEGCDGDCSECYCDDFNECLDTDLDCDDCTDYECEFNPNR